MDGDNSSTRDRDKSSRRRHRRERGRKKEHKRRASADSESIGDRNDKGHRSKHGKTDPLHKDNQSRNHRTSDLSRNSRHHKKREGKKTNATREYSSDDNSEEDKSYSSHSTRNKHSSTQSDTHRMVSRDRDNSYGLFDNIASLFGIEDNDNDDAVSIDDTHKLGDNDDSSDGEPGLWYTISSYFTGANEGGENPTRVTTQGDGRKDRSRPKRKVERYSSSSEPSSSPSRQREGYRETKAASDDNSTISRERDLEQCIYCLQAMPVTDVVEHTLACPSKTDDRFAGFLPPPQEVVNMKVVLDDHQRNAIAHVAKLARRASKHAHSPLVNRIRRLGFHKRDLTATLRYIRDQAPIIIHINLDRVLGYMCRDTHYRNMFEVGHSGGRYDRYARSHWEDRIFGGIYHHAPPHKRVKYGVLNLLGDVRGVHACHGYGDSFLQLKRVRLRATFSSTDTMHPTAKMASCEHYEHVLMEYSDQELDAVLRVGCGKESSLSSELISDYKEVQIHGPLTFRDHVECLVVAARHRANPRYLDMIDQFARVNECNVIWQEDEPS